MSRLNPSRDEIQRLYDAHGRTLLAYGCALLNDVAAAEDVLHQVFARLLRGGLRIQGDPLPYLCRAVRNVAFNYRRARARNVALAPHVDWLEAPPGKHEAALEVQNALAALPPEQRTVIVLHIWGQLTFQEIGAALDIPPNTAASRYRYGLARLRGLLEPYGADHGS